MRTIVLHHHLFKNAGTSLDRILKRNFRDRWITAEFDTAKGANTNALANWITQNPDAIAFSSHTVKGPLPEIDGINIIPVMLLRDPVARIRSAYRFEREQRSESWGAQLAKQNDFAGYVQARLARAHDRQCRNFQTGRLASLVATAQPELMRAFDGMRLIHANGVIGLVSDFEGAMKQLAHRLTPVFPDFKWAQTRENSSKAAAADLTPELEQLLRVENCDDLVVLRTLRDLLAMQTRA